MPITKRQQEAVNRYIRRHYERVNLTMPPEKKNRIKEAAAAEGMSANAFINLAIDEKLSKNSLHNY